jgi:hypothetical protein
MKKPPVVVAMIWRGIRNRIVMAAMGHLTIMMMINQMRLKKCKTVISRTTY